MLTLRPYQREAVDAALAAKRSTIKAATGTGKTIIAIEWLMSIGVPSLIIVPTQALIFQSWSPKLRDSGLPNIGEYYAFSKHEGDIMITTYSSAISRLELLDRTKAVVLDEIHHLGAQTAIIRLLPMLKKKEFVLGLSSVPERRDEAHELFLKEFPICFEMNLGDALRSGIVAPIEVVRIASDMTSQERNRYDKNTQLIQRAFHVCGSNIASWNRCFDPTTRQYVGRLGMLALSRRKKLLSQVESKKAQTLRIIKRHPNERVIVFSESVNAIENIKEFLIDNQIACETYHSQKEPWKRMEILEDWGRKHNVLLSCRALEEGLDVKEVAVGVLISSGASKRQFIQRIGRVVRQRKGKTAHFYVLYCSGTVEETYLKTVEKVLAE